MAAGSAGAEPCLALDLPLDWHELLAAEYHHGAPSGVGDRVCAVVTRHLGLADQHSSPYLSTAGDLDTSELTFDPRILATGSRRNVAEPHRRQLRGRVGLPAGSHSAKVRSAQRCQGTQQCGGCQSQCRDRRQINSLASPRAVGWLAPMTPQLKIDGLLYPGPHDVVRSDHGAKVPLPFDQSGVSDAQAPISATSRRSAALGELAKYAFEAGQGLDNARLGDFRQRAATERPGVERPFAVARRRGLRSPHVDTAGPSRRLASGGLTRPHCVCRCPETTVRCWAAEPSSQRSKLQRSKLVSVGLLRWVKVGC
ncbi:hypothetical protein HDA40_005518 [Hamadaea flava]|nr:hypothetical protein [Hamadaea flava]